jgi:hypothetical protein
MAKSRKYRKNIMKKKVNRSTRSGGEPPKTGDAPNQVDKGEQSATPEPADILSTVTNNPLLPDAASGLSGLTSSLSSGVSSSLTSLTTRLNALKLKCKTPGVITTFRLSVPSIIGFLNIPTNLDEPLNKILGTGATLTDLITDVLKSFECKHIDVLVNILPQVLLFDKIGELLEKPDFSTLDETAKNSMELYKNLKTIINDPNSQDLLCAILNKMESNKHIKSEHKMLFIKLFGGNEEICKGMLSKFGDSITSGVGSLFGSKSGDNANTEPDTRCGENLLVKKSWFSGDYCAPKSNEAPAPAVEKKEEGQAQAAEGADKKEGEAPAVEGEPTEGADKTNPPPAEGADKTNPPPAEGVDKTNPPPAEAADKTNPPPAEAAAEETGEATFTQIPQKKSSWWGGKYKRVKHTKKSKKSKSKKSKRSKK